MDLCAAASALGIVLALDAPMMKNMVLPGDLHVVMVLAAAALLVRRLVHLLGLPAPVGLCS